MFLRGGRALLISKGVQRHESVSAAGESPGMSFSSKIRILLQSATAQEF